MSIARNTLRDSPVISNISCHKLAATTAASLPRGWYRDLPANVLLCQPVQLGVFEASSLADGTDARDARGQDGDAGITADSY